MRSQWGHEVTEGLPLYPHSKIRRRRGSRPPWRSGYLIPTVLGDSGKGCVNVWQEIINGATKSLSEACPFLPNDHPSRHLSHIQKTLCFILIDSNRCLQKGVMEKFEIINFSQFGSDSPHLNASGTVVLGVLHLDCPECGAKIHLESDMAFLADMLCAYSAIFESLCCMHYVKLEELDKPVLGLHGDQKLNVKED